METRSGKSSSMFDPAQNQIIGRRTGKLITIKNGMKNIDDFFSDSEADATFDVTRHSPMVEVGQSLYDGNRSNLKVKGKQEFSHPQQTAVIASMPKKTVRSRIGRRTGKDVFAGKKNLTDSDRGVNFSDFFSDTDVSMSLNPTPERTLSSVSMASGEESDGSVQRTRSRSARIKKIKNELSKTMDNLYHNSDELQMKEKENIHIVMDDERKSDFIESSTNSKAKSSSEKDKSASLPLESNDLNCTDLRDSKDKKSESVSLHRSLLELAPTPARDLEEPNLSKSKLHSNSVVKRKSSQPNEICPVRKLSGFSSQEGDVESSSAGEEVGCASSATLNASQSPVLLIDTRAKEKYSSDEGHGSQSSNLCNQDCDDDLERNSIVEPNESCTEGSKSSVERHENVSNKKKSKRKSHLSDKTQEIVNEPEVTKTSENVLLQKPSKRKSNLSDKSQDIVDEPEVSKMNEEVKLHKPSKRKSNLSDKTQEIVNEPEGSKMNEEVKLHESSKRRSKLSDKTLEIVNEPEGSKMNEEVKLHKPSKRRSNLSDKTLEIVDKPEMMLHKQDNSTVENTNKPLGESKTLIFAEPQNKKKVSKHLEQSSNHNEGPVNNERKDATLERQKTLSVKPVSQIETPVEVLPSTSGNPNLDFGGTVTGSVSNAHKVKASPIFGIKKRLTFSKASGDTSSIKDPENETKSGPVKKRKSVPQSFLDYHSRSNNDLPALTTDTEGNTESSDNFEIVDQNDAKSIVHYTSGINSQQSSSKAKKRKSNLKARTADASCNKSRRSPENPSPDKDVQEELHVEEVSNTLVQENVVVEKVMEVNDESIDNIVIAGHDVTKTDASVIQHEPVVGNILNCSETRKKGQSRRKADDNSLKRRASFVNHPPDKDIEKELVYEESNTADQENFDKDKQIEGNDESSDDILVLGDSKTKNNVLIVEQNPANNSKLISSGTRKRRLPGKRTRKVNASNNSSKQTFNDSSSDTHVQEELQSKLSSVQESSDTEKGKKRKGRKRVSKKMSVMISPDRARSVRQRSKSAKRNISSHEPSTPVHLNLLSSLPRVTPKSGISFRRESSFFPPKLPINDDSLLVQGDDDFQADLTPLKQTSQTSKKASSQDSNRLKEIENKNMDENKAEKVLTENESKNKNTGRKTVKQSRLISLRKQAILENARSKGLKTILGTPLQEFEPMPMPRDDSFTSHENSTVLPSPSSTPVHYAETTMDNKRESNVFRLPDLSHKIIHPKASGSSLRRSQRTRVKRLNSHKGEGIIYRRDSTGFGLLVDSIQPSVGEAKLMQKEEERKKKKQKRKILSNAVPAKTRRMTSHWNVEQEVTDESEISVVNPETNENVRIELVSYSSKAKWLGPDLESVTSRDSIAICMLLHQPSFGSGELHIRPFCEKPLQQTVQTVVYFMLFGKVCVTVNNTSFIVENRDDFFIPRGSTYKIKNLRRDIAQLKFLNFHDSNTNMTQEENNVSVSDEV